MRLIACLALALIVCLPQYLMRTPPPSCTLSPEQLRAQREELLPGLFKRADKVSDISNGLRLRFIAKPGLLVEIARIIEKEQVCCSFLHFAVTAEPGGGEITLDITGPPGTREILQAL